MIRKTIMIRKTRLYPILAALLALVAVPATGFAQVAFQDSNVMSFSTGEAISGGATLSRSANSVQLRGSIAGLDKKGVEYYQITLGGSSATDASIGTILGPGFSAEEVPDAIETIVNTYLKIRNGDNDTFLDVVRRVGHTPFKEALYATA